MQQITSKEYDKTYSLSPIQQGLLFGSLSGNLENNYIMQSIFSVKGRIDLKKLEKTVVILQEEAEILRTSIGIDTSGEYVQWIADEISNQTGFYQQEEVDETGFLDILKRIGEQINLSCRQLFRTDFIQVSPDETKMVWTYHHIILDSISIDYLLNRFIKIYDRMDDGHLTEGKEEQQNAGFREYIKWIETYDSDNAKTYWEKLLDEYDAIADIRPMAQNDSISENMAVGNFTASPDLTEKISAVAAQSDCQVEDVLQAAWAVLLQNYSYSDDVVFGRVYHGRPKKVHGADCMEGVFVSTLPVRATITRDQDIQSLASELKKQREESDENAYCPLSEILSVTSQKKELLKTLFMYEEKQDSLLVKPLGKGESTIQKEPPMYRTEYEISTSILYDGKQLQMHLFGDGRYTQDEIDLILKRYERILESIEEQNAIHVKDIDICLEEEKEKIFEVFNETEVFVDTNQTITDLFEAQVELTPDHTALIFEEKKLTYRQLNEMSNQLANKLVDMGVKPDDFVVIMAKRGMEQIAAVLAVLKAGGAYVPISGDYPLNRIQYMINDCKPKVILTHGFEVETTYPCMDLGDQKNWCGKKENPVPVCSGDNLCYIIYTSGTTGNPKGVMVAHKGVVSLRKYLIDLYEITESDKVLQYAELVFDVSVWEMSMSILRGAALVLISEDTIADVKVFNQFVVDQEITVSLIPPLYLLNADVKNLKSLTTGGSASSPEVVKQAIGNKRYVNAYGPTEITVQATHWEYDFKQPIPDSIPIGKPIYNTKAYIVNNGKICGIGVPGVLYIAGVGVTKGYLNLPELTAEKFTENPYGEGMIYDSGDLVRWLPDGNIEFLGRVDDQVKIRGYRIELDDIAAHIRKVSNVNDVAVIVKEDGSGDPAIFAYLVSEEEEKADEIKNKLREYLPEYSIPTYMIQIDRIPVTKGGKLDKKALPDIDLKASTEYIAPQTEEEEAVCTAFETVLGAKKVGRKDNFFELGGDSIKALRIVSQMNKLGYEVSASVIMTKAVPGIIAALATKMEQLQYEQKDVTGEVIPTPIMRFFQEWDFTNKNHFNQDMLLEIEQDDEPYISEILTEILCHHDILRSEYKDGTLHLSDSKNLDQFYNYCHIDLTDMGQVDETIKKEADNMQASLDLEHGPVMNAAVFSTDRESKLFICIHHLLVDIVSWNILAGDITLALKQKKSGHQIKLPEKTASFIEWSKLLHSYAKERKVQAQKAYWDQVTADIPEGILEIGPGNETGYQTISATLGEKATKSLQNNVGEVFHTDTRSLLISALAIAVNRQLGQEKLALCTEGHGREELHKKISINRTVGWFTSIFPIVLKCLDSLQETIISTKETLKRVPDHGIGYGLLNQKLNVMEPTFFFNYLGEIDVNNGDILMNQTGLRMAQHNKHPEDMALSCYMKAGVLHISIRYDGQLLNGAEIKNLLDEYLVAVEEVIEYCLNMKETIATPSDFSAKELDQKDLEQILQSYGKESVQDIYELTHMQEEILFQYMKDTQSTCYVVQDIYQFSERPDIRQIEAAYELLAKRFSSLNTAVIYEKLAKPYQVVLSKRTPEYKYIDLSDKTLEEQNQTIERIKQHDIKRGFALSEDSLFRMAYIHLDGQNDLMLWSCHHIIMDGWSLAILKGCFETYYNDLCTGISVAEISAQIEMEINKEVPFSEYVNQLSENDDESASTYWTNLMEDYDGDSQIPCSEDVCNDNMQSQKMDRWLTTSATESIKKLASSLHVTVNSVVEASWGILLQKINNCEDIIFGKTVSGRDVNIAGIDKMVGILINTIPVRVKCETSESVSEIIKEIQIQANNSKKFDYYPLSNISGLHDGMTTKIGSLIVFENYYEKGETDSRNFHLIDKEYREETNIPLNLIAGIEDDKLRLSLMYKTTEYSSKDINRILERFELLLNEILSDPDKKTKDLCLVSSTEKDQILGKWNQTKAEYPKDKSIIQIFEEQVKKYGDKVAISEKERQITYDELNTRANYWAGILRKNGILANDFVAITAERTIETMIGIYAILKAGASYVPIDLKQPVDRINHILKDCKSKVLIACNASVETELPIIKIDDDKKKVMQHFTDNETNIPNELAYIMYTSGTTGIPKGVMVTQKNVIKLVKNADYALLNEDTKILQTGQTAFDASTFEIWGCGLNGGELHLISEEDLLEPKCLKDRIETSGINTAFFTAALFRQLTDMKPQVFASFRCLLVGGEAISEKHAQKLHQLYPDVMLKNIYGPTETTTFATVYEIKSEDKKIPIGGPISNTQVYVMQDQVLCGIKMTGELCIAGDGVSNGYLNNPDLTAEKFVPNPFGTGTMYRTGDLARWDENGNIEYLGRMDEQVKINGFRIELGEIEHALRNIPMLDDAIVTVVEDSEHEKSICAYYISEQEIEHSKMKSALSETLPGYMMPSYFVKIDNIVLNRNGKVDKKSLPQPKLQRVQEYTAPKTKQEELVCEVFAEVLNADKTGIHGDFFDLGGNSIKIIRLINMIEKRTDHRFKVKDIYSLKTPEKIASELEQINAKKADGIAKAEEKEFYLMSSAQKRVYFIYHYAPQSTTYNIPICYRIYGTIDKNRMKNALQAVVDRHEILRTGFIMNDDKPVQKIFDHVDMDIACRQEDGRTEKEWMMEFVKPFDLSCPPLIRMKIVDGEDVSLLMLDVHHIVCDGMSLHVLMEELSAFYNETPQAKIRQYKDYSEWMITRDLSVQKNYWTQRFADEIPVLDMPLDYKRPANQSYLGAVVTTRLEEEITNHIKKVMAEKTVSEYMIFLSAAMVLLSKYSGQDDIVIGSPIFTRTNEDTEQMLGMFVNTLAMRGTPKGGKRYTDFLDEIKADCIEAYEHQEYPFEELVDCLNVNRDFSRNPLFDVLLVMQNNEEARLHLEGQKAEPVEFHNSISKFDLKFDIQEQDGVFKIELEYAVDLYSESFAKNLLQHFENLLCGLLAEPEKELREYELASKAQQDMILNDFNNAWNDYRLSRTVVDCFKEQVEKTPDKTAVKMGAEQISFKELDNCAKNIAAILQEKGHERGELTAVYSERNIGMIAGIMGALYAGGGYVPINTSYPADRVTYLIEDSKAKIVLTSGIELESDSDVEVVDITDYRSYTNSAKWSKDSPSPDDLAYCIYTSGTTGLPKGVLVEHRSLMNNMWFSKEYFLKETEDLCTPLFSSHCFDLSMPSIFLPLCFGGVLELIEQDREYDLAGLMNSNQYSFFKMTPSHAKLLLDQPQKLRREVSLAIGGENLEADFVRELKHAYGDKLTIYNEYGPTEATVFTTVHCCNEIEEGRRIPIGRPIPNTNVYIMDDNKICGIGVPGEICIGGMGVARGYLGRQQLTQEKFVDNPYGTKTLYKTGDIGRWTAEGTIEFIGRRDNQVKIRGYRIELGEIETMLRNIDGITDAAVIVRENESGEKSVHAYYVSESERPAKSLRTELAKQVPEYMIPSTFAAIDNIPLTKNGKLDINSLPEIEISRENEYTAPKTAEEKALCLAFEEVLGAENVGLYDDFFDLGGDSIKAIRIVTRMRKSGYKINVKQIMGMHTVDALSKEITELNARKWEPKEEVKGEVIPTPILNHFMNSDLLQPECLTQDVMLQIETAREHVIKDALEALTKQHDMLRSVYRYGKIIIRKPKEGRFYAFRTVDLRNEADYEHKIRTECTLEQKNIDLKKSPLMRAVLFRLPNENKLFLCLHHICVDGLSWQILLEDLKKGLRLAERKKEINLGDKSMSFQRWALELTQYKANLSQEEKEYWNRIEESKKDAVLKTSPENVIGETIQIELDEYSTKQLIRKANNAYHTKINDLMTGALGMAVKNTTGQNKVFVALEGHGREEIAEDISVDATVGWFTSKYPIIQNCGTDIRDIIIETKENLRSVPKHGIGYGLLKGDYKELRDSISLNYLGIMDSENAGKMVFNNSLSEESYIKNLTGMLDIDCYIEKGRLHVTGNYDSAVMAHGDAKKLITEYVESLKEIIFHCIKKLDSEKTISDYSAESLTNTDLDKIYKKYGKDEIEDIYELTPLGEGMLYHHMTNGKGAEYVVQHMFKMSGIIQEKTINEALKLLTVKHEALKTAIAYSKTKLPWQVLIKNRVIKPDHINLNDQDAAAQDLRIKVIRENIVNGGFDIENECLLKVSCIWLGERGYRLIWTYHHLIADGWCASVLFGDFLEYCERLTKGETISTIQKQLEQEKQNQGRFADYVKWNKKGGEESLSYWTNYLESYEGTTELKPMMTPAPTNVPMMREGIKIGGAEYETLLKMARDLKVTLNTVIETAVGITLQRYNHSRDVVFGKVVSGREAQIKGVDSIVGLFVNTIPLRVETKADETIAQLLQKMHEQGIDSVENSRCSLSQIQSAIGYQGELIQVLYAFENYYVDEKRMNTCGFEMEYEREQTNYAVTITAYTQQENLHVDILYQPGKFCGNEIQLILGRISQVIGWMSKNTEKPVEKADTITEAEFGCILNDFNHTDTNYPYDKTVVELVEKQAAMYPKRIALIDGATQVSYKTLNETANQIAWKLRELGVKPNDYVAIMAERTWLTAAGIYGILKSGGAYVPIDPEYPESRRQFIMKDCAPKALLTTQHENETNIPTINLLEEINQEDKKENPPTVNKADDLAYLIYTSGTTGNPKGSMIPHKGIVRLVCNTNYITYDENTVFLQTGSMAFDASTMELWGPLVNGGKLILTSNEIVTSIPDMKEHITKHNVTTIWLTSSLYNQMVQEAPEMFDNLKYLMAGGEKLSEKHVRLFKQRGTGVKMINGYGPTENTTFTTTYEIPDEFDSLPIGKPISNTKVYIMDGEQLCGIGVPGELCTTGDGLSLGYLNRVELTEEKFIQNPFGEGRMYKTGDIAKWLPDGNIAYIGRVDDQVKIHGFRIEIGEVEAALRGIGGIKEAAVLVKGETAEEKALSAYLVSDQELDLREIRETLKSTHPHYMIPQSMMQIEEIPITPNGKLNKQALPEIQMGAEQTYIPPRNEEEKILCECFQEILGTDKVGIHDSFYELGGDSIKAIRIVSYMRTQGYIVTVKEIMNRYTISEIASVTVKNEINQYNQGEANGTAKPTPIISTFIEMEMADKPDFCQDICLKADGCTQDQVRKTLHALTVHHDILRAVFKNGQLEILPVGVGKECEFTALDLTGRNDWQAEMEQTGRRLGSSFDTAHGPLVKAALFKTDDGGYIHLFIHHLVVDGVSWRIIIDDFTEILKQIQEQKDICIPDKTASYIEWTEKINEYKNTEQFRSRSDYWHKLLSSNPDGAFLPDEGGAGSGYGIQTIELDSTISELLKYKAVKMFHTGVNEIILGALCMTIHKVTGQDQAFVMLEGHGREEIHEEIDISRTVGWFTTLYPVLFECSANVTDNIVNTKETLNSVPNHGFEYGLIGGNDITPDIMFNYLGEMEAQSEAEILSFGSGAADSENIKMISPLSVSAILLNGHMKFTFTYDRSRFTDEKIDLLINCYEEIVTECIHYCAESNNSFHTISDLLKDDIEEEDLDIINSLFADLA